MKGKSAVYPQETQRVTYNDAMRYGRSDYEPYYGISSPKRHYRLHCHDFYEFYLHLQGGDYLSVDAETYALKPRLLTIIPPFCVHSPLGLNGWKDYERAYLYVSSDTLRTVGCGQVNIEQMIARGAEAGCRQYELTPPEADECKQLLCEMYARQEHLTAALRYEDYACMVAFFRIVCRLLSRPADVSQPVVIHELVQRALSYINENFTRPITVESLAKQCSVSKYHLSHVFSASVNRSVYDYILYRRVTLAKQLLAAGAPPGSVADQCGFNDYSAFLRVFVKQTGLSPRAYQKTAAQ